jgi:hypothetical protein
MGSFGISFAIFSVATIMACATRPTAEVLPPDPKNPLPVGVDQDPGIFRQTLSRYHLGGGQTRNRTASCFHCDDVAVRIEAVGNTLDIDPNPSTLAPADFGVPVAHLVNLDEKKGEKYYGLKPRKNAEYYLWVDGNRATHAWQWTLVEVPMVAGKVTAGVPVPFGYCNPHEATDPPPSSQADFAEYRHNGMCSAKGPAAPVGVTNLSMMTWQPLVNAIERVIGLINGDFLEAEGGWIECTYGCCT